MAKYGQSDLSVTWDGDSVDFDTINGAEIEAILQQSDSFGDDWVEQLFVGVKRMEPITLEGFYDDEAGGPNALFGGAAIGSTEEVVITWGSTKTTTFDAIVTRYARTPSRGELTRYSVTLTPTGEVVEA